MDETQKTIQGIMNRVKDDKEQKRIELENKMSKFKKYNYNELNAQELFNNLEKYNLVLGKMYSEQRDETDYGILPLDLGEPLKDATNEYYEDLHGESFGGELGEFEELIERVYGKTEDEVPNSYIFSYEDIEDMGIKDGNIVINDKIIGNFGMNYVTFDRFPYLLPEYSEIHNRLMSKIEHDQFLIDFYFNFVEDGIKKGVYLHRFNEFLLGRG